MKKGSLVAIMLIVLQSVLYGLGDPVSKAAYEVVPLFVMLSLRYCIALAVILLIWGKRIITGLKVSSWRDWVIPVLCMGGAYVSNNVGLLMTQATTVAFIRSLPTMIAPVLAFIVLGRKYRKQLIPVQIAVIAGLYMLCCGKGGLGNGFGWGEFFAFLSAVLLAASLVFGERSLERVDAITLSALQTAASAAMALVGMLLSGSSAADTNAATESWISMPGVWLTILYLAILCTIAGYVLQNIALKTIQAHTVAVLQCLCPVMTAAFSWFILSERMSLFGIAGAALILICLVLAVVMDRE